jgi:hypothetical protein
MFEKILFILFWATMTGNAQVLERINIANGI